MIAIIKNDDYYIIMIRAITNTEILIASMYKVILNTLTTIILVKIRIFFF